MKTAEEIFNNEFYFLQDFLNYSSTPPRLKQIILSCMSKYASQTQWISVKERLPESNTPVMAFRANDIPKWDYEIAWINENGLWATGTINDYAIKANKDCFSHWQPLPPPPENYIRVAQALKK